MAGCICHDTAAGASIAFPGIGHSPQIEVRLRFLEKARFGVLGVLVALLVMCLVIGWLTRGAMEGLPFLVWKSVNTDSQKTLVDLRPWQTAQTLAALAVTTEEIQYGREAQRLADHEVDQAFAVALRQANLAAEHRDPTGGAVELAQRVQELQQTVAQDNAQVQSLTASSGAKSKEGKKSSQQEDDLEVAKAQLGLDSDQLNDAQDDLDRAMGDNRAQIKSELAAHEAAMSKYDSEVKNGGEIAVVSAGRYGTLAGRLRGWFKLRSRRQLVQQALQETRDDIARLTKEHNALEAQANALTSQSGSTADRLASLKDRSQERQILSIYDDRIQTEQQLATIYERWSAQASLQHTILLHLILRSVSLILLILIGIVLGNAAVRRAMDTSAAGLREKQTLRSILQLSVQVIGVLLILLVIFGLPQQTPTILGLATAGITIVMQDFILSFFGWFVLMGKNGMRVGDRVEINGVGGEVTEVGLIKTALLEIGKLSDIGLPTGRRTSFMNSFAIRGQYFNFSTAGQWMWDEITVSLPASPNPRPIVERIQKVVQEETRENAGIAVQEWKRTMHSKDLSWLDATPVVNLVITAAGYDIRIRYVTRAANRFEMRTALYRRVFDSVQEAGSSTKEAEQLAARGN
jgi:small-conductance mechanosensitive channel